MNRVEGVVGEKIDCANTKCIDLLERLCVHRRDPGDQHQRRLEQLAGFKDAPAESPHVRGRAAVQMVMKSIDPFVRREGIVHVDQLQGKIESFCGADKVRAQVHFTGVGDKKQPWLFRLMQKLSSRGGNFKVAR